MILTGSILLGVVAAWLLGAAALSVHLGISFRQACLYAPFKLLYRIDDRSMRTANKAPAPVVYAVVHESRLDPALMLSLLPRDTLHILDDASAASNWLEPWRALARTIVFNSEHVFVSRRLVRVLKGRGRLAVYLPDDVEPDAKTLRLFRAVARIALRADARVVPIRIAGARYSPFSLTPPDRAPRSLLPNLAITALEPLTIAELQALSGAPTTASNALFDRLAEARLASTGTGAGAGLFNAIRDAADRFGPSRVIVEDVVSGALTYRRLLIAGRVIGKRVAAITRLGEPVGLMLPNANGLAASLAGLFSAGRVATMINYTAGTANVAAGAQAAGLRRILSSRVFVEKAGLAAEIQALNGTGAEIVWLEDLRDGAAWVEKALAAVLWRKPIARQDGSSPAVILFTSGSEGTPKPVVLSHRNLAANVAQVESRIAMSPRDRILNVLPAFHSFGLTGGTILPMITGVRLFLYPSPLHYRLIPQTARKWRPTAMFGTDTFLAAYARSAEEGDFSSLRFAVAGGEPVKPETRREWRARFGAEIVEGFGVTETAPVIAVNTASHSREGTVGRLLPGMRVRLEAVEGIAEAGRLFVSGPNVMLGMIGAGGIGDLQAPSGGWHDTGDIVSFDREGFMTIRGRAKRFAKIAGEMVSLGAVEMLVQALWPEERHAVVALPDRRRGERIVLVTTAERADPAALRRHGKQAGVTELALPAEIVKVDDLPLLGSGKTDYPAVTRLVQSRLGAEVAA